MNDSTNDFEMANLERSLCAVADEDANLQAPPHVQRAVMQTWDAWKPFLRPPHRRRRLGAVGLAIGAMAAAVVAAVVMYRAPVAAPRRETVVAHRPEPERAVISVPAEAADPPAVADARAPRPRPRVETTPTRYGSRPGLVLLADPILDTGAMSIVRVRVPRTALVTLGLPLVEPNEGGSVDLEMLVGEDGVARTIRRAVAVTPQE
jgi:hypothetical protein